MADRRVKRVTIIPTIKSIEEGYTYWKKVAAYARVSTGSEPTSNEIELHIHTYRLKQIRDMCVCCPSVTDQNPLSSASNSRLPSSPSGASALGEMMAEVPSGLLW